MNEPLVSVVMGVYNGAEHLEETLDSVLSQRDCDLEFIVVDDGSTDETGRILDQWASRDPRLHVIHQQNTGLTRALIRGCEAARGEYIARQDGGDVSLPGRLSAQAAFLAENPHVVMVAGATRFVGPKGEPLYDIVRHGEELDQGLAKLDVDSIQGPSHHGCTMFRRSIYQQVGGYRPTFVVAQDIDLWLRLAERGACWGMERVLYEARLAANSISGRRRADQFRLATLAVACAKLRRSGVSDQTCIDGEMALAHRSVGQASWVERSRFNYFMGACLSSSEPMVARQYFMRAWLANPLALKALARIIIG